MDAPANFDLYAVPRILWRRLTQLYPSMELIKQRLSGKI
jgi:hypothetical protein